MIFSLTRFSVVTVQFYGLNLKNDNSEKSFKLCSVAGKRQRRHDNIILSHVSKGKVTLSVIQTLIIQLVVTPHP